MVPKTFQNVIITPNDDAELEARLQDLGRQGFRIVHHQSFYTNRGIYRVTVSLVKVTSWHNPAAPGP